LSKNEHTNYEYDAIPRTKAGFDMATWVVCANTQNDAVWVCLFFLYSLLHAQVTLYIISGPMTAQNVSFRTSMCLLRVWMMLD